VINHINVGTPIFEVLETKFVTAVCEPVAQCGTAVVASLDFGDPAKNPLEIGRDLVGN
tara:strand:+ start:4431 stop:4604 length:174 start_codon:yes stop_codon:yes gene_type:complete